MRDIRFRCWDIGNKEMLGVENLHFDEYRNNEITIRTTMYNDYFNKDEMILMQYTGLKDKNGTEIYEGDIIEVDEDGRILFGTKENPSRKYQLVGFHDGSFMTGRNNNDYETMNTYLWILKDYITIAGNIYNNPELLEKGE